MKTPTLCGSTLNGVGGIKVTVHRKSRCLDSEKTFSTASFAMGSQTYIRNRYHRFLFLPHSGVVSKKVEFLSSPITKSVNVSCVYSCVQVYRNYIVWWVMASVSWCVFADQTTSAGGSEYESYAGRGKVLQNRGHILTDISNRTLV